MRRSSLKTRSTSSAPAISGELGFLDRQRLLDAENVERSDVPAMSRVLEGRPSLRGWSQPKVVTGVKQEASPLRSKLPNRVQQQRWFIPSAIEVACRTLLVIHAGTPFRYLPSLVGFRIRSVRIAVGLRGTSTARIRTASMPLREILKSAIPPKWNRARPCDQLARPRSTNSA